MFPPGETFEYIVGYVPNSATPKTPIDGCDKEGCYMEKIPCESILLLRMIE